MYTKQDKANIRDSLLIVDSEICLKNDVVLENIINYLYDEDIYKYKLVVNMNSVLYITDGSDSKVHKVNINETQHTIESTSILRFEEGVLDPNLLEVYRMSKSVVIIGPINRMDPFLVESLFDKFNSHIIVLYGDSALSLDSEYDNRYSIYFANSKLDVSEVYSEDSFDVSKKKIYNVLSRVRKNVPHEKISRSLVFSVTQNDVINVMDTIEYIDSGRNDAVVVPDIYFNLLNSNIRYYKTGDMELKPKYGDKVYNIYPIILKDINGVEHIIDSFSEVLVTSIETPEMFMAGEDIVCSLNVSINGNLFMGVLFDYGFFIENFNSNMHPDEEEYFTLLNQINGLSEFTQTKINHVNHLRCVPYKILKPMYVKYCKLDEVRVYDVLENPNVLSYMINTSLYNSVCTTRNKIELIEGPKFNIE